MRQGRIPLTPVPKGATEWEKRTAGAARISVKYLRRILRAGMSAGAGVYTVDRLRQATGLPGDLFRLGRPRYEQMQRARSSANEPGS